MDDRQKAALKAILGIAERMFIQHGGKVKARRAIELATQFVSEADQFMEQLNKDNPEPEKEAPEEVAGFELVPDKTVDLQ